MTSRPERRPLGVIALSVFFALGAVIASLSAVSLLIPASGLEPIWRVNPQAHAGLLKMGADRSH